ncbi:Aminotransferase, class V domain protein [Leptospira interrogans serovar Canicola]|nr:Aminotransferase, class V domain protein [Leptospira interrogans serovar Canicola]
MGASGTWIRSDLISEKEYAIFRGGNQENNHRAGTENSPSILSLSEVLKHRILKQKEKKRTSKMFSNSN